MIHRVLNLVRDLWAWLVSSIPTAPPVRPPQSNRCYILRKIPLELRFLIVEQLGDLDCKILAQTCPQLRNELHSPHVLALICLTYKEHCELLARVSRDDPNVWACEKCHTLHGFHLKDTYGLKKSFYSACSSRRAIKQDDGHYGFWFWPRYRHVQMALKLHRQHRLSPTQELYLKALVRRSYYVSHRTSDRPSLRGAHEVCPRIVEGSFLLKIVQYVEDTKCDSPKLFLRGVGDTQFGACEHQQHTHEDLWGSWSHQYRRREQARRGKNPGTEMLIANEEMETAVEDAFLEWGEVVEHSCSRCPTDFTVQIWQTSAVLCVWADLGGETVITDEIWDVHKQAVPKLGPPYWDKKAMEHEPGSVRRMYGSVTLEDEAKGADNASRVEMPPLRPW